MAIRDSAKGLFDSTSTYRSTIEVLKRLESSPFDFYLTGSRFFGLNDAYSDYDYFVKGSVDLYNFLIGEKFYRLPFDLYDDPFVEDVYEFGPGANHRIHIQIGQTVEAKIRAQNRLLKLINKKPHFAPLLRGHGPQARALWTLAYMD